MKIPISRPEFSWFVFSRSQVISGLRVSCSEPSTFKRGGAFDRPCHKQTITVIRSSKALADEEISRCSGRDR
jgi:hypothetical protein